MDPKLLKLLTVTESYLITVSCTFLPGAHAVYQPVKCKRAFQINTFSLYQTRMPTYLSNWK